MGDGLSGVNNRWSGGEGDINDDYPRWATTTNANGGIHTATTGGERDPPAGSRGEEGNSEGVSRALTSASATTAVGR